MPENHAAHLRLRILEHKIAVTGSRAREVRDLAAYPGETEVALNKQPRGTDQQRHRQHGRRIHELIRCSDTGRDGSTSRPTKSVCLRQCPRRIRAKTTPARILRRPKRGISGGAQILQPYEKSIEKDGKNLSMTMKSLPGRSLSK